VALGIAAVGQRHAIRHRCARRAACADPLERTVRPATPLRRGKAESAWAAPASGNQQPGYPPVTTLTPMRAEAYDAFVEQCIASYASDNVESHRWAAAGARERASAEFARLMPEGLQTPGQSVYEIDDGSQVVGFLWLGVHEAAGMRSGYVYSIQVRPEFRGQGHASAALLRLEEIAVEQGLMHLALHVFAFNTSAQALYRSLGYGITGVNMLKPLRRDGA
jgi:ribosomal protein S18 acetylase RimI-like enzyme